MTASASGPYSLRGAKDTCQLPKGGSRGPICSRVVLSLLPSEKRGLKPIQPQHSQTETVSQLFLNREAVALLHLPAHQLIIILINTIMIIFSIVIY